MGGFGLVFGLPPARGILEKQIGLKSYGGRHASFYAEHGAPLCGCIAATSYLGRDFSQENKKKYLVVRGVESLYCGNTSVNQMRKGEG